MNEEIIRNDENKQSADASLAEQYALAVRLANGIGVEKNLKESFALMKKLAEDGYVNAYAALASRYYEGSGTARDIKAAESWAKKAVEEGGDRDVAAKILYWIDRETIKERTDKMSISMDVLNWGNIFYRQKKYTDALKHFIKAAQMGNPVAMNDVSYCYYNGKGVKASKTAAFEWMKRAAENGYEDAYATLAAKYYMGEGTAKNYEQAEYWAQRAINEKTKHSEAAADIIRSIREQNRKQ